MSKKKRTITRLDYLGNAEFMHDTPLDTRENLIALKKYEESGELLQAAEYSMQNGFYTLALGYIDRLQKAKDKTPSNLGTLKRLAKKNLTDIIDKQKCPTTPDSRYREPLKVLHYFMCCARPFYQGTTIKKYTKKDSHPSGKTKNLTDEEFIFDYELKYVVEHEGESREFLINILLKSDFMGDIDIKSFDPYSNPLFELAKRVRTEKDITIATNLTSSKGKRSYGISFPGKASEIRTGVFPVDAKKYKAAVEFMVKKFLYSSSDTWTEEKLIQPSKKPKHDGMNRVIRVLKSLEEQERLSEGARYALENRTLVAATQFLEAIIEGRTDNSPDVGVYDLVSVGEAKELHSQVERELIDIIEDKKIIPEANPRIRERMKFLQEYFEDLRVFYQDFEIVEDGFRDKTENGISMLLKYAIPDRDETRTLSVDIGAAGVGLTPGKFDDFDPFTQTFGQLRAGKKLRKDSKVVCVALSRTNEGKTDFPSEVFLTDDYEHEGLLRNQPIYSRGDGRSAVHNVIRDFLYGDSEVPRKHMGQTPVVTPVSVSHEVKPGSDPLVFMRTVAKELGKTWRVQNNNPLDAKEFIGDRCTYRNGLFFEAEQGILRINQNEEKVSLEVKLYNSAEMKRYLATQGTGTINRFMDYLNGDKTVIDTPIASFDMGTGSISDFGRFAKDISLMFFYKRTDCDNAVLEDIKLEIEQFEKGVFGLKRVHGSSLDHIGEVSEPGDYRPFLQEVLERLYNTSEDQRKDPLLFSDKRQKEMDEGINTFLHDSVDALFLGEEKEDMKEKLKQARILAGKWISIPRLNLGPSLIPAPGQRKLDDLDYVLRGGDLLIEALHLLEVPKEELEDLMLRKTLHKIRHTTRYQHSRKDAFEVMRKVRDYFGLDDYELPSEVRSDVDEEVIRKSG